ncbi:unnamed protein product [Effrenium voratum]|nr:unnamed protein product [Effrenium voratum]
MRLPKVKNKNPAPVQVTVNDIIPNAGPARQLVRQVAPAAGGVQGPRSAPPVRQVLVLKDRPPKPSTRRFLPALRLRRRGDWPQRRLLCIAVHKEDASRCPMARLPQGFLKDFLDKVFSFLSAGPSGATTHPSGRLAGR